MFVARNSNIFFSLINEYVQPFTTQSLGLNVCKVNPEHQLMVCGSNEGRIEAWDPRSRQRAATLDSAFSLIQGTVCTLVLTARGGLRVQNIIVIHFSFL